ncbi:DUF2293 domain-containing protein [Cohaesibacter celericrescens]|uniref:DUF2293 domain-containing protein n=1 Tax=Cohaesibacter celericrescens TaxID=2067669 RepID=UPI003566237A
MDNIELNNPTKTKRFQRYQLEAALIRHFPNSPQEHASTIIEKSLARDWTKQTSMTKAISIVVHNYIRHNLTDYEKLLTRSGITRDEARIIVKPEVDDWFEYWHAGTDALKPSSG